jgi:hypothetical protein
MTSSDIWSVPAPWRYINYNLYLTSNGIHARRFASLLDEGRLLGKQAGAEEKLTAAEQRQVADFLSDTHQRLRLWGMCKNKACRRTRACGGDVDECGARCGPQRWKWVHQVVKTIRVGRSGRAAARAADRHLLGGLGQVTIKGCLGTPSTVFWVEQEGKWTAVKPGDERARPAFGAQFWRLTGAAWLRTAPRGSPDDAQA